MKNIYRVVTKIGVIFFLLFFNFFNAQCGGTSPVLNPSIVKTFVRCPGKNVSISLSVNSGLIPPGAEVRWFDNSTASGVPLDPDNIEHDGDYYAFYYYPQIACYSEPTAPVTVKQLPNVPAYLNSKPRYFAPGQIYNLRKLEEPYPTAAGLEVKWYSDAAGTIPVSNPQTVDFAGPANPGQPPVARTFYIRYEIKLNAYSCNGPLQAVEIKKIAPFPQVKLYTDAEFDDPVVTLGMGYRITICEPIDLTLLEVPAAPAMVTPGTFVKWYYAGSVNADSQINANVIDPSYWTTIIEVPNPYFAGGGSASPRYYDPAIDYYGPQGYHDTFRAYHTPTSTYRKYATPRVTINFDNSPPNPCTSLPNGGEPNVLNNMLKICSGETADLTAPGIIEPWTSGGVNIQAPVLYWYTNEYHTNSPVTNPSAVGAGTYYPFYYYSAYQLFRPIKSVTPVTVTERPNCNECTQPGNKISPAGKSLMGISTMKEQTPGWPQDHSAFLLLESKNKGFVITRTAGISQIIKPVEGMLIYDTVENNLKLYNGTIWKAIEKNCNEWR